MNQFDRFDIMKNSIWDNRILNIHIQSKIYSILKLNIVDCRYYQFCCFLWFQKSSRTKNFYGEWYEMPQKACERLFCHVMAFSDLFEMPQK